MEICFTVSQNVDIDTCVTHELEFNMQLQHATAFMTWKRPNEVLTKATRKRFLLRRQVVFIESNLQKGAHVLHKFHILWYLIE